MKSIYFLIFTLGLFFSHPGTAQNSRDFEQSETVTSKNTRKKKASLSSGKNYQKQFKRDQEKRHRTLARKAIKTEKKHLKSMKRRGSDGDIQINDVMEMGEWTGGDIKARSKYNHREKKEKKGFRLFKKRDKSSRKRLPERE